MKRILFVDDEPKVLDGLRRMLRTLRREWDMEFAAGGPEALERLAAAPFEVVVTDMRMPGMTGSELLKEVMRRYPATVRIILSGQCDRLTVLQAVTSAHQFLTKPCDSEILKSTVARACRLRDQLPDPWHKQMVSRVTCVPSMPAAHAQLKAELESSGASVRRVAEIIAGDVGMTAKIMQLISTSFFGTPQRCSDPIRAVSFFDLDTIRTLAASREVFFPFEPSEVPDHFLKTLGQHGAVVAQAAKEIARAETPNRTLIDDAYLGGLLHDVGIFLMIQYAPERYTEMLRVKGEQTPLWKLEQEYCGATHSDVGGYLIGLWGLPDPIVQAVALHHMPERAGDRAFSPLTAVHVANAVLGAMSDLGGDEGQVNTAYLHELGLAHRLPAWEEICRACLMEEIRS